MDAKLKRIIIIVLASFFILILFLFLLTSCKKKYLASELEIKIVESAKEYYSIYEDELPSEGTILTLSLSDLVAKGVIDELEDLLDKDTNCSGSLTIENNNNYYMYSPTLDCTSLEETYHTTNLKDTLLENIVTSGNGLYRIGNAYYFRGDNVNNRIIFDGILWRIMKVNSDGSIRLIEDNKRESDVWDDRYNSDIESEIGINDYIHNDINSIIKDTLDNIYNTESVLSNSGKGYIKKTTLCIGKRNELDTTTDGSIECSKTLNNQYLGLIQINEFMIASLDSNCTQTISNSCSNYNYLSDFENSYWSITADSETTHKVYNISSTAYSTDASNVALPRLVINISENTTVSGAGTEEEPYIVTGFDSELKKFDN